MVKQLLPAPFRRLGRLILDDFALRKSQRAWNVYHGPVAWLGLGDLERLAPQFSLAPRMQYDAASLLERGTERGISLLSQIRGKLEGGTSLELGCGDGMVSRHLQERGFKSYAVDQVTNLLDPRAAGSGVVLSQMDAARLEFDDSFFDLVFCFNTFEHFSDPGRVLDQIHRVLKPGGYFYCLFNPIYSSPFGLHAYYSIPVPYCQFLFPRDVLDAYCSSNNMEPVNYGMLNEWTPSMFRKLWLDNKPRFTALRYHEQRDCSKLNLVVDYVACFKGKVPVLDDLVIAGMECFFQKRLF